MSTLCGFGTLHHNLLLPSFLRILHDSSCIISLALAIPGNGTGRGHLNEETK